MRLRCHSCGLRLDRGTMLAAFKEDLTEGERYIGVVNKIFRFYLACVRCSAHIIYKTDPDNSDYTVEAGATREFE